MRVEIRGKEGSEAADRIGSVLRAKKAGVSRPLAGFEIS